MELTEEQVRAAKSCGCNILPASESQIHRLTVQRRIFQVGGAPHVVTRDGSFFETHGTLFRLIAEELERAPVAVPEPVAARVAVAAPVPEPEPVAQPVPAAEPEAAPPEVAAPVIALRVVAAEAPVKRGRGRPRKQVAPVAAPIEEPAAEAEAVPAAPQVFLAEPAESDPESSAALISPDAVALSIRRRPAKPASPRWMTAGPERRGRLRTQRPR